MRELIITKNEADQRLDKLLAKYLNQGTKSFIYKMLRKKNIVLNDKKAQGDEKLKIGDSVKLYLAEDTINKFSNVSIQRTNTKLNIIFENDDVIFINKPTGMLSQKAEKNDESVVEHLITYLIDSNQLTIEQLQSFKPSICNRLDRNTSGLITAGKSLAGLQGLSHYFKERDMKKFYIAFVKGHVSNTKHIKGYLCKDNKTNKVRISDTKLNENDEWIETEYKSLWKSNEISLLEIHLITGKSHQIRAHLSHIGHPIIGDTKYGDVNINKIYRKNHAVKHQLLHAYRLEFPFNQAVLPNLSGNKFIAPLPAIYQTICIEKDIDYGNLEF